MYSPFIHGVRLYRCVASLARHAHGRALLIRVEPMSKTPSYPLARPLRSHELSSTRVALPVRTPPLPPQLLTDAPWVVEEGRHVEAIVVLAVVRGDTLICGLEEAVESVAALYSQFLALQLVLHRWCS